MFRLPIVKFFSRILNRATITIVLVALQVLWLLWAFWAFTTGRVWLNGLLKALSIPARPDQWNASCRSPVASSTLFTASSRSSYS